MAVLTVVLTVMGHAESPQTWRRTLEADWLTEARVASLQQRDLVVTPQQDAAGGYDGIKNGKWGFHTDVADKPWWQVDLGPDQQKK